MKLITTFTITQEVSEKDLKKHYNADTIEQAAANQCKWIQQGMCDPGEFLDYEDVVVSVVAES